MEAHGGRCPQFASQYFEGPTAKWVCHLTLLQIYAINIHSSQLQEICLIQTECIKEFSEIFLKIFYALSHFGNAA